LDFSPFFQLWRQPAAKHRLDGTNVTPLLMALQVDRAQAAAVVHQVDHPLPTVARLPMVVPRRHMVVAVHQVGTE
jgi:hypothetical protein